MCHNLVTLTNGASCRCASAKEWIHYRIGIAGLVVKYCLNVGIDPFDVVQVNAVALAVTLTIFDESNYLRRRAVAQIFVERVLVK